MDIVAYKVQACKFDYEFLGKTVPELASQYGFPADSIQEEIDTCGWLRKIEPTTMPDTKNIQDFANALEEITRSKLSIISLFRQIENQPMVAQLEKIFLEKAIEIAMGLKSEDDKASTKLNNLVKAINQLQDRNPIDLADQLKEAAAAGGGKVVVNIANQLN